MKRILCALTLIFALALVVASPASASVSNLSIESKANLSDTKTSVVLSGTITCTAGNEVSINANVLQSSGQVDSTGVGSVDILCTGQVETWSMTVDVFVGSAFKKGPAIALFAATDQTDGSSSEIHQEGIKIQ